MSMYGIRTVRVSQFHQSRIDDENRYWCVCKPKELSAVLNALDFDHRFDGERIVKLAGGECVFLLNARAVAVTDVPVMR